MQRAKSMKNWDGRAFAATERRVRPRISQNSGFTLVELSISVVLLTVVTLLGFVASSSSLKANDLNFRMTTLQEDARSTMRALSDHVQRAVRRPPPGIPLPSNAQELKIVDTANPKAITFVLPTDLTGIAFTDLITIQFESEDKAATGIDGGEYGNGKLDSGEDANSDGLLNRRLVMVWPDGTREVLGGCNDLANVAFSLSDDGTLLGVTITASMRLETGKTRMLKYSLASNIFLMN